MPFQTLLWLSLALPALAAPGKHGKSNGVKPIRKIQLGPRPYWLIDQMDDGPLKRKLESCSDMEMRPTAFSISHRGGGTLQFPEHTKGSIVAGTRMGALIQECDVTFTLDQQLVCRHSQCDLHTTTNIVNTPLNAKCAIPFVPFEAATKTPATAKCCTSDFTLAELGTLCAKMDASNPRALTPQEFVSGTPMFRTDLYSLPGTCEPILSFSEYISLVESLGPGKMQFTPELKSPAVSMPFPNSNSSFTQQRYAQAVVDEFTSRGISPSRVWLQSFDLRDILYWIKATPEFAQQAILLDESADYGPMENSVANLTEFKKLGVKIVGPPLPYLVETNKRGEIIPSKYAKKAKELGLGIITWSLERSGWLGDGTGGGYYFATVANVTRREGDVYKLLDVLARDVGVRGVFSDWSATVTYYANCFGIFP